MRNNAVLLGMAIAATAVLSARPAPASTLINIKGYTSAMMSTHSNSQGYLGVGVREVAEDQLNSFHVPASRGLEIVLIDHDAPAAKAGLKEHDVILRANGETVDTVEKFRRMVRETPPDHLIALVISRDGSEMTINVKVANRAEVEKQAWSQHMTVIPESDMDMSMSAPSIGRTVPGSGFFATITVPSYYTGVIVDALGPQLASFFGAQTGFGLLVKSVDVNSPASAAGIRAGDVIIRVGATQMATRADFYKAVRENKGKQITVTLLRDKKEQTVTLSIGGGKGNKSRVEIDNLPEMVELQNMDTDAVQSQVAELEPEIEQAVMEAQAATGPQLDQLREQMQNFKEIQPKIAEQMKQIEPQLREQMKQLHEMEPKLREQMKAIQPQIEEQMKNLRDMQPQLQAQMKAFHDMQPKIEEQMKAIRPQIEEQMKQFKLIEPQLREQLRQLQGLRCTPMI